MTTQKDKLSPAEELDAYRASDPLLFLNGVAIGDNVTDAKFRHLRAKVLQSALTKLHQALRLCDFRNEVVVRPEGVFVDAGGVLMEVMHTPIYLKSSRYLYTNQAEEINRVLTRMNIRISTVVDVGANFGEISLWLAREYPQARVIAVEPSGDNLMVFQINKDAQSFSSDCIELVREAICDRRGSVSITKGVGTMNRVMPGAKSDSAEVVTCDRLDSLFDRYRIHTADFVKIDIEGGEPALREAIACLGDRVRSYYIEFSKFAPREDYLVLAETLLSRRFICYDEAASTTLGSLEEIDRYLQGALAPEAALATNLWFIAATAS